MSSVGANGNDQLDKIAYHFDRDVVTDGVSPEECIKYYSKQPYRYDEDVEQSNYKGPEEVVTVVKEFQPPISKEARFLDVCAGTGRLARMLKAEGFHNIDGTDGSSEMMKEAMNKGTYKKTIVCLVIPGQELPIEADSYDVMTASGAFAPGHLYSDSIPELLRVVKPGGFMIWAMREGYEKKSPQFEQFDSNIEALVKAGKVELVMKKSIPLYLYDDPGFVYVLKKLSD